jgi:hypothetical protein
MNHIFSLLKYEIKKHATHTYLIATSEILTNAQTENFLSGPQWPSKFVSRLKATPWSKFKHTQVTSATKINIRFNAFFVPATEDIIRNMILHYITVLIILRFN